jgi:hypothetical protein
MLSTILHRDDWRTNRRDSRRRHNRRHARSSSPYSFKPHPDVGVTTDGAPNRAPREWNRCDETRPHWGSRNEPTEDCPANRRFRRRPVDRPQVVPDVLIPAYGRGRVPLAAVLRGWRGVAVIRHRVARRRAERLQDRCAPTHPKHDGHEGRGEPMCCRSGRHGASRTCRKINERMGGGGTCSWLSQGSVSGISPTTNCLLRLLIRLVLLNQHEVRLQP